jgi:hypothetical protein
MIIKYIKKTSSEMRRFEVHKSVQLSNTFFADLEKLGKFYDKHKDTLFADSSVSLL